MWSNEIPTLPPAARNDGKKDMDYVRHQFGHAAARTAGRRRFQDLERRSDGRSPVMSRDGAAAAVASWVAAVAAA